MRFEQWKVEDLIPYENNPRIIDKATPIIVESIRQVGYISPIIIDEAGVILAGHARLAALKEIGEEVVDVIVAEYLTEEEKKKYRLLDNKTGELASWDNRKLKEELAGVDFNGFDFGQEILFPEPEENPEVVRARKVICPRCKTEVEL